MRLDWKGDFKNQNWSGSSNQRGVGEHWRVIASIWGSKFGREAEWREWGFGGSGFARVLEGRKGGGRPEEPASSNYQRPEQNHLLHILNSYESHLGQT